MTKKPTLNKKIYGITTPKEDSTDYPVKVLQVGDGNFIRAFIDWLFFEMNQKTNFQGKVATIQALPGDQTIPKLNNQDMLFTLVLRGKLNGKDTEKTQIIDSIDRGINPYSDWMELLKLVEEEQVEFLFSNTTEAGIQYTSETYRKSESPLSYPGKVTSLLYHRYVHFQGDNDKGWIIIPCELIENNGDELKKICLQIAEDWDLPDAFVKWIHDACVFCNTLVDRIVPGYPKMEENVLFEKLGYKDELLTVAEPYHLFVIEGPDWIEEKLPFKEAGLNVQFDCISSYRELKVKLLNAPHIILALIGLLHGIKSVREGMEESNLYSFIDNLLVDEILATMQPDLQERASQYIEQVYDRFLNPFLDHKLSSISLNSYSKFKTRVWPSIRAYRKKYERNPKRLVFTFAALLHFYKGIDEKKGYEVMDDETTIIKFQSFYDTFDGNKETLFNFIKTIVKMDFQMNDESMNDLYAEIAEDFLLIEQIGIENALLKIDGGN